MPNGLNDRLISSAMFCKVIMYNQHHSCKEIAEIEVFVPFLGFNWPDGSNISYVDITKWYS